jgi:hypothetical protein
MANISLALYTKVFFGSAPKLPIQIGTLSIDNSVRNISRLGTYNALDIVFVSYYSNCTRTEWRGEEELRNKVPELRCNTGAHSVVR